MHRRLSPEERLELLRVIDRSRPWHSLGDKRFCELCERVFSGWQIEIDRTGKGLSCTLHCPTPGCPSEIRGWLAWRPVKRRAARLFLTRSRTSLSVP